MLSRRHGAGDTKTRGSSMAIKSPGETIPLEEFSAPLLGRCCHCRHLILPRPGLQSLLLHWQPTASQPHRGLALRADGRRAAMPKFMQSDS